MKKTKKKAFRLRIKNKQDKSWVPWQLPKAPVATWGWVPSRTDRSCEARTHAQISQYVDKFLRKFIADSPLRRLFIRFSVKLWLHGDRGYFTSIFLGCLWDGANASTQDQCYRSLQVTLLFLSWARLFCVWWFMIGMIRRQHFFTAHCNNVVKTRIMTIIKTKTRTLNFSATHSLETWCVDRKRGCPNIIIS